MSAKKSIKFLNITNLSDNVALEGSKNLLAGGTGGVREMCATRRSYSLTACLLSFRETSQEAQVQKDSESPEEKLHDFLHAWVLHLFHHPDFRNSLI